MGVPLAIANHRGSNARARGGPKALAVTGPQNPVTGPGEREMKDREWFRGRESVKRKNLLQFIGS